MWRLRGVLLHAQFGSDETVSAAGVRVSICTACGAMTESTDYEMAESIATEDTRSLQHSSRESLGVALKLDGATELRQFVLVSYWS